MSTELERAISAFDLGGTTAIYDALLTGPESQFSTRRLHTESDPLITDGGDNSSRATLADALDGAIEAGIVDLRDRRLRRKRSRSQAGTDHEASRSRPAGRPSSRRRFPKSRGSASRSPSDIRQAVHTRLSGAEDGEYHRIRVTAKDAARGPLEAQTRAGYIANRPSKAARKGLRSNSQSRPLANARGSDLSRDR